MRLCINWISNPITSRVRNRFFFPLRISQLCSLPMNYSARCTRQAGPAHPPQGVGSTVLTAASPERPQCKPFSLILFHLCSYPRGKCTLSTFNRWWDSWIQWLTHVTTVRLTVVKPGCETRKPSLDTRPQALNRKCFLTTAIATWPPFTHWEHTQRQVQPLPPSIIL